MTLMFVYLRGISVCHSLVKQHTRNNRTLDMVFTDQPEHFNGGPLIKDPTANSDHATVLMSGSFQSSSPNVITNYIRPPRD